VLIYALPDERLLRAQSGQDPVQPAELVAAAAEGAREESCVASWNTELGQLLRSLLQTAHFGKLGGSDEELAQENPAAGAASGSASAAAAASFSQTVERVRSTWSAEQVGDGSGLLQAFRGSRQVHVRGALLDLCCHLDRLVFFLAALRPHHQLANMAGDIAMCWLRKCLSHLLQEIERVVAQLRQARIEVMKAAKCHLQDLAKRGLGEASQAQIRWMQGLRHVDEAQLDRLHRALLAQSTDILAAATVAREAELHAEARLGLEAVVSAFRSADFQSRCALAPPEGLAEDMRLLNLAAAAAAPDAGGAGGRVVAVQG